MLLLCGSGFGWALDLLGNGTLDEPLSAAVPRDDGSVDTGRSWIFFLNNGAKGTAVLESGTVQVVPEVIDAPAYGMQLIQSPVTLDKGAEYELSFDARSTSSRPITVKVGGTAGRSWTAYSGERKVDLTAEWDRYTVAFRMSQPSDPAARVEFWFTQDPDPVWLDNIVLVKTSQAEVGPSPVSGTKTKADEDKITRWELVWSDEFEQPSINSAWWTFEKGNNGGWGNNELEYYTDKPSNASIQKVDGTSSLVITARKEEVRDGGKTYQYTSARMVTKDKVTMKPGQKIEIRAKLPQGQGIWPALWLLGDNIDQVPWPACGEIDIMELIGHQPGTVYSTVHGPVTGGPGVGQGFSLPEGQKFADGFHVFTFEWHPHHLEFLIDGQLFFVAPRNKIEDERGASEWVYDHPYFLILNVAVGGNWPGSPDATTVFPQSMAVDSIRIYENVGAALGPGEVKWVP